MGAALKKDQDYYSLARLRWAAWGVINIEQLERMQRRNYINHVREELKLHGMHLEAGGSKPRPFYRVFVQGDTDKVPSWAFASSRNDDKAFQNVCLHALLKIDPTAHDMETPNG